MYLSSKLAKVKRYEAKLSVVAFVGVFDEVMSSVVPVRLMKLKKRVFSIGITVYDATDPVFV